MRCYSAVPKTHPCCGIQWLIKQKWKDLLQWSTHTAFFKCFYAQLIGIDVNLLQIQTYCYEVDCTAYTVSYERFLEIL
jgi:hypothetical protein